MKYLKLFTENNKEMDYERITKKEWAETWSININPSYVEKLRDFTKKFEDPIIYGINLKKDPHGYEYIELFIGYKNSGTSRTIIYYCEDYYFLIAIQWGSGSGWVSDVGYFKCDEWQGVEKFFTGLKNGDRYILD